MIFDIAEALAVAGIVCGLYFTRHLCCGASLFLQALTFLTRCLLTATMHINDNDHAVRDTETPPPPPLITDNTVQEIESPVVAWKDLEHEDNYVLVHEEGPAPVQWSRLSILDDYEAIVADSMPLDEEIVDQRCFHWEIRNWHDLPERHRGSVVEVGGHKWNLYLFPRGNNVPDQVSVYLELTDAKNSPNEYACAQFAICISNPIDPTYFHHQVGRHRFCAEETDWGFAQFVHVDSLTGYGTPTHQQVRPFLHRDTVRMSVIIQVVRDPTGVLWRTNFANYDSKKMTGFVGLRNQGATCYMNSLFQSLYCTNAFRKAVYQIPTDQDGPTESLSLAIQRLFYNLQYMDKPVDTFEVTRSFGWDPTETFMQHDIQEFNRILQEALEIKMKNTPADGAIKNLFVGRMKSYIRCINVNYESTRSEDYYDIQLNVKGCKDLEQSFAEYIAEELMDGENKYMAEGYGLQDAKKGVIFESFPPVLHLQLKRFEYDIMRDAMVKINDRHEFPLEIDLEKFLCPTADRSQSHKYVLHGVLVHSGDLTGGHYFGFIKPSKDGKWLKFDDDRVTLATMKEVLEDNYGGEVPGRPAFRSYKRWANAYMLVYIRECLQDQILAEVSDRDIPTHLVERFELERLAREKRQREQDEQHLYLKAQIFTMAAFMSNYGPEFVYTFENLPENAIFTRRVRRDQPLRDFKNDLAESLNRSPSSFNLWSIVTRSNQTLRPDALLDENNIGGKLLEQIQETYMAKFMGLFLEDKADTNHSSSLIANGEDTETAIGEDTTSLELREEVLVLVKRFDPEKQILRGVGCMHVYRTDQIGSHQENIGKLAGYDPGEKLILYEEVKPGSVEILDPNMTFERADIENGDILCIQRILEEEELRMMKSQGMYSNVREYLEYLYMRIDIPFIPRIRNQGMPFVLQLRKDMKYNTVIQRVADMLDVDPAMIQLFKHVRSDQAWVPLRRTSTRTLEELLLDIDLHERRLLYQVYDISLAEMETKRTVDLTVCIPSFSESRMVQVLVSRDGHFSDLLKALETQGAIVAENAYIFGAIEHRYLRDFPPKTPISLVPENSAVQLFLEPVPDEDLDVEDGDQFIPVFHFHRRVEDAHSIPFRFLIKKGESIGEIRKRLQARVAMSSREWDRVQVVFVSSTGIVPLEDDSMELWGLDLSHGCALGLDHPPKQNRAMRASFDRPLSIRG